MNNYVLSAFADEYSSDFITQLKALNDFGFSHIEVRGVNGINVSKLSVSQVKETKKQLSDYGVKVSSIGSPLGKINIDDNLDEHLEMARHVFYIANEFGTKNVRMFSFYLPSDDISLYRDRVFDALAKMTELAKSFGVTLCHENEAKIYGESPTACLEILEYFGGKIKCVFDMGNFVLDGFDAFKAYELLKSHIEYFHIKDALKAGAIVPCSKGEAQIEKILDDYATFNKKSTFITLEPHLQTFDGLNALVGKAFDNPYKYKTAQDAFSDAVQKLKEILK